MPKLTLIEGMLVIAIVAILLAVFITGCDLIQPRPLPPILSETATVADTVYKPGTTSSGFRLNSHGHIILTDDSTDPTYAVILDCQHGRFAIEGSDERAKGLWSLAAPRKGKHVGVKYTEVYGKRHLISMYLLGDSPL